MGDDLKTRGGAGQLSWLFMLLAIVLGAGFMIWLGMTAEPTTIAVVEPTMEEPAGPTAQRLSLDDLANATQYEGQTVEVANVPVVSVIAPQLFWTVLPNSNSYLIRLAPALVEQGHGEVGKVITVTGTIRSLDADVIAQWREAGVITSDGEAQQIQGIPTYLDVSSVPGAGAPADAEASAPGGN